MRNLRLVARLDIKAPNLIKGVHLEGLRVLGDPHVFAERYYAEGIDEILYMDIVASLYGRNNLTEIIERTAEKIFIPITVGGGVRSVDDATRLLRCGADKVALNTAATKDSALLTRLAERFGSQCVVLSIEAKRRHGGGWEAYTDNGRDHTGRDVVAWAIEGTRCGAGEILLTSIDQEGTCRGFDVELLKAVTDAVDIPVIASGGMGTTSHLVDAVRRGGADAIAMAHVLHYGKCAIGDVQTAASAAGIRLGHAPSDIAAMGSA